MKLQQPSFAPEQIEQLQKFQEIFNSMFGPYLLKFIDYISDERFMDSVQAIMESGQGKKFFVVQAITFLLFIGLRSYTSGKIRGFMDRFIFGITSFALYFILFAVAVPGIVYGKPYVTLVTYTWEFALKQF